MLRAIYERILGALRPKRRKPPRRARGTRHSGCRQLAIESLEGRRLLTTATLTYGAVSDGNFAAPALSTGAYQIAPWSCPWQFSGNAGVSANNSAFTQGDPNSPSGVQVGYIKNNASISQIVYLDAGVYNLSALAAQRLNYNTQNENVEVLVDNVQEGVLDPASPVQVNNSTIYTVSYTTYQSWNFAVAAGWHTVELLGLSPATADSTTFLSNVAITPVQDAIVNGSFEQPSLPVNGYQTDPSGLAWQFSGTAGVARNGSDFLTNWVEAQNAPLGSQVAYLENTVVNGVSTVGSMSQTLFLDPGTYQVSFLAAQRAIYQSHYEEVDVKLENNTTQTWQDLGTIDPANTSYQTYQASTFTVATSGTGPYTLDFVGVNPQGGDDTIFLDAVSLSANAILDGSFETLALNAPIRQADPAYQPNINASAWQPWQFSGAAGVVHNGAAFTANNGGAADGTQVAYLPGASSISQSVTLIAGTYNVSFMATQLANGQSQPQQVEVLVVNSQSGAIANAGVIVPFGINYHPFTSVNFTEAAGTYTIELVGLVSGSTALIDEVSLTAANDAISDGNFATPSLTANSSQVQPSGSAWQFSGSAGVTTNGGSVASGSASSPTGGQAGFLTNGGSMSQTVYLDANTYDISFMAAQCAVNQTQNQEIEVVIDPNTGAQQVIGMITPSVTTASGISSNNTNVYALYQTSTFQVPAGTHVIEFLGLSSGQSTALIDEVSIAAVENTFADASFAAPVLPEEGFAIAPTGSAWQYSGLAGISANLSAFTNGSAYAPAGNQVAFIKDIGSISQAVQLDTGTYSISFEATQRINYQTQAQSIDVEVVDSNNNVLFSDTITPVASTDPNVPSSNSAYYIFTPYQTANFPIATTGQYTVEFVGTSPNSADSTAFVSSLSITSGSALSDGSFEEPALQANAYAIAPAATAWQFSGIAGVSANASGFTYGNPAAPDGYQLAFVKNTGSMSQQVYLAAGIYNLSFMAAQRDEYQTQFQTIEVLIDANTVNQQIVGMITPSAPQSDGGQYPIGTSFGLYSTANFWVPAGQHTITFLGMNPTGGADNTAFIDSVHLNV